MEDKMKEVVLKAETLIEALPYIRDFNGKKVVVKYGGSAMLDEKLQESVIKDVALLKLVGMQPIIVHEKKLANGLAIWEKRVNL